jgi:hypothetical protein
VVTSAQQVEEIQGLYGPFHFPELLFQRIWAEQAFADDDLRTEAGEPVRILHPGQWNRQGGPDFRSARIEIAGRVRHGDIELHLREQDWSAHGHRDDPAYGDVILHVVLFPCRKQTTRGVGEQPLPILVLLPHLWHDLEEYAADAAVAAIAQRPADHLVETWRGLSPEKTRERLVTEARKRWHSKVHYARQRIERLGWTAACHHTALEILGYRFNRAPMLAVATAYPLVEWQQGRVDLTAVYDAIPSRWRTSGVRPPNHPRRRLEQYARWVAQGGHWPEALQEKGRDWPQSPPTLNLQEPIARLRRGLGLPTQWRRVMTALGAAEVVARPRADNLWGDGFLPLLAAKGALDDERAFLWWFCSWPGDQAAGLVQAVRLTGIAEGRQNPLAWGHVQGLLGQQLAIEAGKGGGLDIKFSQT